MNIQQYLTDTFLFNSGANLRLMEKIREMPDKSECIRLMSHLVNCQYKWMARIRGVPGSQEMSWWDPLYDLDEMAAKWEDSLRPWLEYIASASEETLATEVTFIGAGGHLYAATALDIALQLNYHSIHHRAQMQTHIRTQGVKPDFVDYIGTRFRKVSGE